MEKIELEIVALSHSIAGSHSYAVVLGERKGVRRLPIVIGGPEAQAIAVALEKMNPSRPLTHDLMKNLFVTFDIQLKEVVISNLKDGIFYAQLICERAGEEVEIDSRTSDALAMAVRFGCPVYTYEFILDQAGIIMEGGTSETDDDASADEPDSAGATDKAAEDIDPKGDITNLPLTKLQELLDTLLSKEAYEEAARVRDEIQRREKNS